MREFNAARSYHVEFGHREFLAMAVTLGYSAIFIYNVCAAEGCPIRSEPEIKED